MRCSDIISVGAAIAVGLIPAVSAKACPPLGAVLPPPLKPSSSENVKTAAERLQKAFKAKLEPTLNMTGISIGVKSIHEDEKLFDYHFTPPQLSGIGTSSITDESIFRIGSLSKVFAALAVLQTTSISMDDSIVKYLPSLGNTTTEDGIDAIAWSDVTVGSLMTHMAGVARDTAMDMSIFPGPWTGLGLPKVAQKDDKAICSGLSGTPVCTSQDLLREVVQTQPIFKTYTSPSYSNVGFALLGTIVEAATGKTFEELVQKNIYDVVGMKSSSFNGTVKAFPTEGFVPVGETTWNVTLGVYESAGGMFTSTNDMLAFGQAVLQNKVLSPTVTRQWLKPYTHTSSLGMSVGAPWEILRSDSITLDGRVVDVYSKSGDLGLYHAYLGLNPDYDLVITVLTGGIEAQSSVYFSNVVKAIVPAVDQATREEASCPSTGVTGIYVDKETNSTLVLRMDSGPGLLISKFSIRNADVLKYAESLSLNSAGMSISELSPSKTITGRFYPTNIEGEVSAENATAWRAVFDTMTNAEDQQEDHEMFWQDGSCISWFTLDSAAYDLASVWDFDFLRGEDGAMKAIKSKAFDVTLTKVDQGPGPHPAPHPGPHH